MNKIFLEGADNAREFGGLKNESGREIRARALIRSNHLGSLTVHDRSLLHDLYHVGTVIDLRTSEEVREKPDTPIEGAAWIHIPVFEYRMLGITHEEKNKNDLSRLPDLAGLYRQMVSNPLCVEQIKKVFRVLSEERSGAVLWHCTEGKDRCGLISALVLYALGFHEETILEDYLFTNQASGKRAAAYYEKTLRHTADEALAGKVRRMFLADASYLKAATDEIADRYGSVALFLENALGVDTGRFRQLYLEPAG